MEGTFDFHRIIIRDAVLLFKENHSIVVRFRLFTREDSNIFNSLNKDSATVNFSILFFGAMSLNSSSSVKSYVDMGKFKLYQVLIVGGGFVQFIGRIDNLVSTTRI